MITVRWHPYRFSYLATKPMAINYYIFAAFAKTSFKGSDIRPLAR
jgi:hypothetical protein